MLQAEGMYPLMLPNIRGHFAISEMTAGTIGAVLMAFGERGRLADPPA